MHSRTKFVPAQKVWWLFSVCVIFCLCYFRRASGGIWLPELVARCTSCQLTGPGGEPRRARSADAVSQTRRARRRRNYSHFKLVIRAPLRHALI